MARSRRKPIKAAYKRRGGGWLYPLLALLLLPAAAACAAAAWQTLRGLGSGRSWLWPAAGAAAYGAFQLLFRKPMGLYVFGHELTHALAAFATGLQVRSFRASPGGGEVLLSGTNVWVALAPYCVPLYTVLVLAVFQIVRWHAPGVGCPPWFGFAVGFTLAFHAALTLHALSQNQPDLRHAGAFFSLTLILLANGLSLVLVAKALFPSEVSLRVFASEFLRSGLWAWEMAARAAAR
ncbi:MAG: hypothetical protein ACT4O3_08890 [Elusimicrobiota bacterium]